MKVLLLVLFMCAYIISITTGFYGKGIDEESVMKAIEGKCITADNIKKFQGAYNEFNHCVSVIGNNNNYPAPLDPFERHEEFCTYLNQSDFHVCTKNFTSNILPCLDENEIYLQEFLLNADNIAFEEFCGENGASNMQYVYDKVTRTGECIQMCGSMIYYNGACNTTNLSVFKNLDKGVLNFNKNDLCRDLESLQKCATLLMENMCNEEYSRFIDLILNPFLKGCNDLEA